MPRIPHTEPADALGTFKLAAGFSIEMVASEPMVSDPVDACFDEYGRMFVAEMHGYPFSHEPTKLNPKGGGKKDAGIIRLLEDTDGDGRMDKSVVFADQISWPTSVCCYNGGVFVMAPQHLYYFKDTDGDNKADVREVVLSGFGRGNVQSVSNGLQWGLDNRIYMAAGRNPKNLLHRGKPLFPVGGSDLRFDPKTETFEIVTGGLQFGHARDDWGTRFVCSNSNHMMQIIYPQGYLARNPFFVASGLVKTVATDGASARVFRRSPPEPWRIVRQKWRAADKGYKLVVNDDGGWEFIPMDPSKKAGVVPTEYPVGFFTSATGITIYRGNAYPERFRGNAFVGDVGGNLVHRKLVDTSAVTYAAKRADEGEELVASTDNWFRPVNFVNAPDGSLYVLDMYRETIEHPYSIPEEIKAFLDLSSGDERGRIYRLVSPDMKRITPEKIGSLDNSNLVYQLASKNAWNRDTALRLIWERQDRSTVPFIELLLRTTNSGKLHALCALDGLGALTTDHLRRALGDKHPRIRAHAIRLSEPLLRKSSDLLPELAKLADDESEHVRFQLAFSLGETDDPKAVDILAKIATDVRNGPNVQTALLSSTKNTAGELATRLLTDSDAIEQKHVRSLVSQLCIIAGSNPDTGQAQALLRALAELDSLRNQQLILTSLGQGLARRGASISKVIGEEQVAKSLKESVNSLFTRAATLAEDEDASTADRILATRLLAHASLETAEATLPELLSSRTPQLLQQAAVQSLAGQSGDSVGETLLEGWKSYSPIVRGEVVDALLTNSARTMKLLKAVEDGAVKRGDIDRTRKQTLLSHRNSKVKNLSVKLFGSEVNTNRSKVVAAYQDVLKLDGNSERGRVVFKKTCSTCHKVGDIGHQVAPDLSSVKNKSEADLLLAVLDPNREAQPNYNTYSVITIQGRTHTGIIASETANSITLRRAEAKEDVILRTNIDELVASGVSLMPEGLEKDLSKQQLADVIAFVKSIPAKTK